MKRFKGQVVWVTGSTRGIGRGVAEAFAHEGAQVVITGRQESSVQETVQSLVKNGAQAQGYACDVTNPENVQETVRKILDKQSHIDILVNNAGITKDNLLLRLSESDWDEVIRVNLKGVFNVTKVVARAMLKARQGKIINIASSIGITGNIGQANYAASKASIIGFSKSVARELASRGITVNVIAPGYIQTEMTSQIQEKTREEILKQIPLGRFGEIADVAQACLFMASPAADYITGQTLVVDGGLAV